MKPLAAIDPGRSKCGLVFSDPAATQIVVAGVLAPEACLEQIQRWRQQTGGTTVVLGDGTGSRHWQTCLKQQQLTVILVPESGSTLAARRRYWQLEPARGWRRLLPEGMRLPPRDVDDVVAQLLLERHLGRSLERPADLELIPRTLPAPKTWPAR